MVDNLGIKDLVYFGGLLLGLGISWAKTNAKIRENSTELKTLKEMIELNIEKEKMLFQKEFETINSKIDTYFKKIDELRERMINMEKRSISFVEKDEIVRQHPTKDEVENKLNQLEKVDDNLKDEIISLRKDLSKKFDNLEKGLKEHIKEERESQRQNQDTLNQILLTLKDR
jgi:Fe2+ transport system protein B